MLLNICVAYQYFIFGKQIFNINKLRQLKNSVGKLIGGTMQRTGCALRVLLFPHRHMGGVVGGGRCRRLPSATRVDGWTGGRVVGCPQQPPVYVPPCVCVNRIQSSVSGKRSRRHAGKYAYKYIYKMFYR